MSTGHIADGFTRICVDDILLEIKELSTFCGCLSNFHEFPFTCAIKSSTESSHGLEKITIRITFDGVEGLDIWQLLDPLIPLTLDTDRREDRERT